METTVTDIAADCAAAKKAARVLAFASTEAKDHALESIAAGLRERAEAILEANPAAGSFLATANLVGRFVELLAEGKQHEFYRYHLNRWVSSPIV